MTVSLGVRSTLRSSSSEAGISAMRPLHQRLAGRDELHDDGASRFEVGLHRADERGALHRGEQVPEEALLAALEGGHRGGLRVLVPRGLLVDDAGGLERLLDVVVDDLEGARVGVVDAPLGVAERVLQDVDLDPVVAEGTCLIEPEGLQVPGDHLQCRDPARLHRGDEVGAGLERRLAGGPETEALGVGESGDGGGAGRRDVGDARVGERALEAKSGPALLRGGNLAAIALRARRVRHRVRLVEDDDAVEGVAVVLVERVREPADDLVEPRGLPLPGRRAQRRVGGEEDPLVERDLGALAELPQGDDVLVAPAERSPVAARVLDELVGLGEPEGALPAAEPLVEHDGGDLASLAAPGAVAEGPAAAEPDRGGQDLAVAGGGLVAGRVPVADPAPNGLPARADAVVRGEVARVGLAREHHALELGVGQKPVRDDSLGEHRAVRRRRVRHRGHGGGLHERRGMGERARHAHRARAPRRVGAGGGVGAGRLGAGLGRGGLHGELGDLAPVAGGLGRGLPGRLPGGPRRGTRRRRGAEEVRRGRGLDGQARRHRCDDGIEELGRVGGAGAAVDVWAALAAAVQHGEAGVEAGAAPGVGAPVDGRREDDARVVERGEGGGPLGVARHAVRRGDRGEPSARGQHREGGAQMPQVRVVADAGDPRRRRERRVHHHRGGPQAGEAVGDGLGVVAGDARVGKERGEEPCAHGRNLVQVQRTGGAGSERALGHHREHAGAGAGFEHDVARAHRGGPQRGVGEWERGRELLEADLRLGALGVRGLQCRDGVEYREHPAGAVGSGAGPAAHGAPVALEKQHDGGLGRLVGVLPDPGADGVARPEGRGHGGAQGRGVEGPAGFEHRHEGGGRGEQGRGAGGRVRRRGVREGVRRARGGVRRRNGVEHGVLRIGRAWKCRPGGAGAWAPARPLRTCPRPAGRPLSRRGAGGAVLRPGRRAPARPRGCGRRR